MRELLRDDLLDFEFFNFEPAEDGTISQEQWLLSVIKSVNGKKKERCRRQIKKICDGNPDARVTKDEFLAFAYWLSNLNYLRSQIMQYRYLDHDSFTSHMNEFCKRNDKC